MPLVTLLLVTLNAAVYALELSSGGMPVCEKFGLVPAHPGLGSLLTYSFLHDPRTLVHLGCNMAFLAVFGSLVERVIGGARFLCLYALAAVAGAALHIIVASGSSIPMVGASGAVCGLVTYSVAVDRRFIGFAFAFCAVSTWQALTGNGGDVSVGAHIGGLFVGVVAALFANAIGERGRSFT
jgi:membrane associated rhomboid family serine protease